MDSNSFYGPVCLLSDVCCPYFLEFNGTKNRKCNTTILKPTEVLLLIILYSLHAILSQTPPAAIVPLKGQGHDFRKVLNWYGWIDLN
jgi:hypothetical protein